MPSGAAIPIAAGVGGIGLGAGLGGKKGGGADFDEAERLARIQGDIARQLFEQFDPLRTAFVRQLEAFIGVPPAAPETTGRQGPLNRISADDGNILGILEGSIPGEEPGAAAPLVPPGAPEEFASGLLPPSLIPAFAPLREATEEQFDVARENLLARSGARGGQLTQALQDIETGRAQAIGALEAPLRQDLFNQALSLSFGQVPVAQQGLSSATAGLTQLAGIQAQQQAAQGQAAGSLVGLALKLALKGGGGGAGATSVPTAGTFTTSIPLGGPTVIPQAGSAVGVRLF